MKRKFRKTEDMSNENNSVSDESNDLQTKNVATSELSVNKNNAESSLALNINVNANSNKNSTQEENVTSLLTETSGYSSRLRRRFNPPTSTYCAPESPSFKEPLSPSVKNFNFIKEKLENQSNVAEKVDEPVKGSDVTNHNSKTNDDYVSNSHKNSPCASIALDKMRLDFSIESNVADRYPPDMRCSEEEQSSESPDTRRERIDIISRQCRLHPANKKYNQGPVENPQPITPGILVGYTPGGQRHEVDLNFGRPSSFNSEYERMQWDYATKINVCRMMHELETGTFLPDGLDPAIERRYFAEQEMVTNQATEHFQELAGTSAGHAFDLSAAIGEKEEEEELIRFLETEKQLLELNKFASVRIQDCATDVNKMLRKALDLPISPLMIKKNPIVLNTLETLASQCVQIEVVLAARALLEKIQGLFQVPENKTFKEYFAEEVENLKKKTKNFSAFDIFMMHKDPPEGTDQPSNYDPSENAFSTENGPNETSENAEFLPVEDGDVWIDEPPDFHSIYHDSNSSNSSGESSPYYSDSNEDGDSMSELSYSGSDDENEMEINSTFVSEE